MLRVSHFNDISTHVKIVYFGMSLAQKENWKSCSGLEKAPHQSFVWVRGGRGGKIK